MKVTDLARVVSPQSEHEFVGIRPGEKLHEQMIGIEDSDYTYEYDEICKFPAINDWHIDNSRIDGIKVNQGFIYSSDNNKQWMNDKELESWINKNKEKIGKI